jgi:hypothetical protein
MKRQLTATAVKDYTEAPPAVQKAFDKQAKLLVESLWNTANLSRLASNEVCRSRASEY